MNRIKYILIILIISFSIFEVSSQETIVDNPDYKPKHSQFTIEELNSYLREHVNCLNSNEEYNIQFVVETTGIISDFKQSKETLDKTCLLKVKMMIGTWIPGKNIDREPVNSRVSLVLPIIGINKNNSDNEIGCISGDCENGLGVRKYVGGDKYEGEWKNGKCNGNGTLFWASGNKYIGQWKDGNMTGLGSLYTSNGSVLTGNWLNGELLANNQVAKLGRLELPNGELDMMSAIPVNISYPNTSISYTPFYNTINWGYLYKKYFAKVKKNGTTTTQMLHVINEHSTNIFTKESYDYDLRKNSNYGDAPLYNDIVNNDCDFDLSKLFYETQTTSAGTRYRFIKPIYNESLGCIDYNVYPVYKSFEYKMNGNIETFNITNCLGGINSFGFIAKTSYKQKPFLFIYDVTKDELDVIDLNSIPITDRFSYNVNDATLKSLTIIGQTKYIVLQFSDRLLPIIINGINKNVYENIGYLGAYKENVYHGWSGDLYNLWNNTKTELIGFVNAYSENNEIEGISYKINLFDKSFTKKWEMNLKGMRISIIKEVNGFIVIGGFTIEKGYVGYPNPRVVVVNKRTKEITYDNVIPQKNGTIAMIGFDEENNVEFTTAIYSATWNYTKHFPLVPLIIRDKLNSNGKFENDLFIK